MHTQSWCEIPISHPVRRNAFCVLFASDYAALIVPPSPIHFVRVERRSHLTSATLAPETLARLQSAFSRRWFIDGWARRSFRDAARRTLREDAPTGLVLLGRGMQFDVPPAFEQPFEPVELGVNDPQLTTLAGPAPTREERVMFVVWIVIALALAALAIPALVALFFPAGRNLWLRGGPVLLCAAALIAAIVALARLGSRWLLVPGGVVIARRWRRPARPELLTRSAACAVLRYVHTGKTVILTLELWPLRGKVRRRAVSQREAIALLAAWQSPHPPPTAEQLRELFAA
ncbi:hypothetical protein RAS1_11250 [Phycisphaerae bacterium RAS1]|nr:hypothetical protein RAS1_11250 [Phycisphaerae bacterium RAS1]